MLQCTAGGCIQATGKRIDPAENPYAFNVNTGQERTGAGTQSGSSGLLNSFSCTNFKTILSGYVPFNLTAFAVSQGHFWLKKTLLFFTWLSHKKINNQIKTMFSSDHLGGFGNLSTNVGPLG